MTYLDEVEKIAVEDREFVREELIWLTEWLKQRYPDMSYEDLRKFVVEMLTVSV